MIAIGHVLCGIFCRDCARGRFAADASASRAVCSRSHEPESHLPFFIAPTRMAALESSTPTSSQMLAAMNFEKLSEEDQVDYLLLKNQLTAHLRHLAMRRKTGGVGARSRRSTRPLTSINERPRTQSQE